MRFGLFELEVRTHRRVLASRLAGFRALRARTRTAPGKGQGLGLVLNFPWRCRLTSCCELGCGLSHLGSPGHGELWVGF